MKSKVVLMAVLVLLLAVPLLAVPAGAGSPQGNDAETILKAMSD